MWYLNCTGAGFERLVQEALGGAGGVVGYRQRRRGVAGVGHCGFLDALRELRLIMACSNVKSKV